MKLTSMFVALGMLQAALAQNIAPSPTESIGCEPHGDHWHCEGPRPTEAPAPSTPAAEVPEPTTDAVTSAAPVTSAHDHDDHDDHDEDSTVDPGPSPTESEGCEPHGDHWHCEGPKETGSDEEASGAEPEPTGSAPIDANAAGALEINLGAAAALAAFALL